MKTELELLAKKELDKIGLCDKLRHYDCVYIYGAGYVGNELFKYLIEKKLGNKVESFVVTNGSNTHKEKNTILGKRIEIIDNVNPSEHDIFLVAVKKKYRAEMVRECKTRKIRYIEINQYDDRDYNYYSELPYSLYPIELEYWYKQITGDDLNIHRPKSFNEKIQWIKAFERDERKTIYTDKYKVREYVKERIGEKYLISNIGVWDKFEDIPFETFPEQFVLKTTHGSSQNLIVKDKSKFDKKAAQNIFKEWLNINHTFIALERHYYDIKPRIIAEQFVEDKEHQLFDYKIWCFDGRVKFIQVDVDRYSNHSRNLYTPDWELLPYEITYEKSHKRIKKPERLKEMINLSERLSKGFNFVRVDLYYVDKKILFGEMTFTPGGGTQIFRPIEFDNIVGSWFKI